MNNQATYEQVEMLMNPGDYDKDPACQGMTVREAARNENAITAAGRSDA